MNTKGKFITFEGVDGAGKSSHIDEVISFLELKKNCSNKNKRAWWNKTWGKVKRITST